MGARPGFSLVFFCVLVRLHTTTQNTHASRAGGVTERVQIFPPSSVDTIQS